MRVNFCYLACDIFPDSPGITNVCGLGSRDLKLAQNKFSIALLLRLNFPDCLSNNIKQSIKVLANIDKLLITF